MVALAVPTFGATIPLSLHRTMLTLADRALPWPHDYHVFGRHFGMLVKRAGVRPGTFKWLRRSAGSYAESMQPGAGTRLLGHRDANVFNGFYRDDQIVQQQPIEPPDLGAVG